MMACRTTFFHIPLSLLLILIPCPPASLLSALCEVEEGLGMHEGCSFLACWPCKLWVDFAGRPLLPWRVGFYKCCPSFLQVSTLRAVLVLPHKRVTRTPSDRNPSVRYFQQKIHSLPQKTLPIVNEAKWKTLRKVTLQKTKLSDFSRIQKSKLYDTCFEWKLISLISFFNLKITFYDKYKHIWVTYC